MFKLRQYTEEDLIEGERNEAHEKHHQSTPARRKFLVELTLDEYVTACSRIHCRARWIVTRILVMNGDTAPLHLHKL